MKLTGEMHQDAFLNYIHSVLSESHSMCHDWGKTLTSCWQMPHLLVKSHQIISQSFCRENLLVKYVDGRKMSCFHLLKVLQFFVGQLSI